jgi:ParB family chromosome partitioning protein
VVNLARSIAALGLLEPLVIDETDRLLAGGHRIAACRLLAAPGSERQQMLREICRDARIPTSIYETAAELEVGELDPMAIPVRVMPFRAEDEPDRALAIEAAENTQRRNYSPEEIRGLYRSLLDRGYTDRPGRPRRGEKAAKPVLAAVVGRSQRQIERLLARPKTPTHVGVFVPFSIRLAAKLSNELREFCEARGHDPESVIVELVEKFVEEQRSTG